MAAERIDSRPDTGRPRTASVVNLGCKVNQSEMEAAARLLRARGMRIVGADEPADLVLVNTCTVTAVADQKSRQAVRRARRTSPAAEVIVTGCSVQVSPAGLAAADPMARLVDNTRKPALLDELARLAALPERPTGVLTAALPTLSGAEPGAGQVAIDGIADGRTVADRTRAFVKVQDGCSFFCTYCIIPQARGAERSIRPAAVLADVRRALAAGHREIVLTGINIGTYDGGASERGPRGSHRWSALTLAGLVRRILGETAVERIRLSSIEPQHVTDDLLAVWTGSEGRCLPHFHVPLQSGDDGVLRAMGRRYTVATYLRRLAPLQEEFNLTSDVIVGFPAEDERAFEGTLRTAREAGLTKIHVFPYSPRPGTPTAGEDRVPPQVKRERGARLRAASHEACLARWRAKVGRDDVVLVDRPGRGYGDDYSPWLVRAEVGELVRVRAAAVTAEGLLAA